MAMILGVDVAVADDESVSGTGLKREMFDADLATSSYPAVPSLGQTTAPFRAERPATAEDIALVVAARVAAKREQARRANAYASAIYSHLTTYAVARIVSESCGVTPDPLAAATPIGPPAVAVDLQIF